MRYGFGSLHRKQYSENLAILELGHNTERHRLTLTVEFYETTWWMLFDSPFPQNNNNNIVLSTSLKVHFILCNPYQNLSWLLCRNWHADPKIHMKLKEPKRAKTILKGTTMFRELVLYDFKTYYKAKVIKTTWYWHKDIHIDLQNRSGSPEIHPYTYNN